MYNNQRLGLCCLLVDPAKTNFKTVRKGWADDNASTAAQRLISTWSHNLQELVIVLDFCINNNIWSYRISSDMFPLADLHPHTLTWHQFKHDDVHWNDAREKVRQYIELGGRLSTHPGQFCVMSSDRPEVVHRSVLNLELHADFFDALHIDQSYFFPINIHISNGTRQQAAAINTQRTYETLSASLRSRLVFETEDKNYWTWQRIIEHFPGIPVTLDYHHRNINNLGEDESVAHQACVESWRIHNIKPLFHYTEGKRHALDRSHADYITQLPPFQDVDLEIEAKAKQLAIFNIRCISHLADTKEDQFKK